MAQSERAGDLWTKYWITAQSDLLRLMPPSISRHDAEDLRQEVALAALVNAPRRRTRKGFLAFAKGILNNKCADSHRRRSRLREHVTNPADLDARSAVASNPIDEGQPGRVRKMLPQACLSRREQDTVTVWLRGVTEIKAIARELGIQPSTVRQYLSRAFRKLRTVLEIDSEYSPPTT